MIQASKAQLQQQGYQDWTGEWDLPPGVTSMKRGNLVVLLNSANGLATAVSLPTFKVSDLSSLLSDRLQVPAVAPATK